MNERLEMTQAEYEKILTAMFETLKPLRLKQVSPKHKKRLACLCRIAEEFVPGRLYTEKEVNALLMEIYDDCVLLRRELVDSGLLERKRDGSAYWVAGSVTEG